ncbi:hypothetical protein QBA35_36225 [Streptomyces bottropensis]|uniref:Uncharacterized protein n=1 Tax=Streptomyces bottropensis TaxID=42235 RepID=A0ABU8AZE8_9ACTN
MTGPSTPTGHDGLYPAGLVVLAHQRLSDIIEAAAAAAYTDRVHGWRNLHPGDDPSEVIHRIPRAVHTHGVDIGIGTHR